MSKTNLDGPPTSGRGKWHALEVESKEPHKCIFILNQGQGQGQNQSHTNEDEGRGSTQKQSHNIGKRS
jgi:hypothetical protein